MADQTTTAEESALETTGAEANVVHDEPQDPGELDIQDALAEFETVKGELSENSGSLITTKSEAEDETTETTETEEAETTESGEGEQTGEENAETVEPPTENVEEDTTGVYSQPVEDPGEFKPGDYSFSVTLTDGKTYQVKSQEDADAIADLVDEQPDLMTAKSLIAFQRGVAKMDAGIEADQRAYNERKQNFETYRQQTEQRDATIMQINNGINYLQTKGLLPPVDPKFDKADIRWEDHADEPGIKERLALLKYMDTENNARIEAGLPPSFDIVGAFNGMRLEQMQNKEVDEDKADKQARRQAGSRVAGQSKSVQTTQRKGEIVGVGGSLDDLLADYY